MANSRTVKKLFGLPGSVLQQAPGMPMLFIATTAGATDGTIFAGPVLTCRVKLSADMSIARIARALFALSSFGAAITTIIISGVLYARYLCASSTGTAITSVSAFYNNYNIGDAKNIDKRLFIHTKSPLGQDTCYLCVLIDLLRDLTTTKDGVAQNQYTLTLLGTPYKG